MRHPHAATNNRSLGVNSTEKLERVEREEDGIRRGMQVTDLPWNRQKKEKKKEKKKRLSFEQ